MHEMDEEVRCDSELLDWFYLDNFEDLSIALSSGMRANVWFVDEDNPPDDTRDCVGVNVYLTGVDVAYPTTVRAFLEAALGLYDTTDVVESWHELEDQVMEIEGIRLEISRVPWAPGRWEEYAAGEYPYHRAAPGSWTLARWRRTRLEPQLPTHPTVRINYPDGREVPGQTRLTTVRKAWSSSPLPTDPHWDDRVFAFMRDARWAGYILHATETSAT